jgi:hypothetical protein
MSFEKPGPRDAERMSKDAAHDEANMLRVHLGVSAETGKISKRPLMEVERDDNEQSEFAFVERKPGAEDYDKALQALAELEQDRQYESSGFMRGLIKANQLVRSFGLGGLFAGRALNAAMSAIAGESSPQTDFYRTALVLLRVVMALLAVAMDLAAGLALHEAWRMGSDRTEDCGQLQGRLTELLSRKVALAYEVTALQNEPAIFINRFWSNFYRSMLSHTLRSAMTKLLLIVLRERVAYRGRLNSEKPWGT